MIASEYNLSCQLVLRRYDQSDDESVQTECFSENQNKHHTGEKSFLLRVSSDACIRSIATCVSDDSDGQSGSQTRETAAQSGAEVRVRLEELVVVLVHVSEDDDRHDQTVQTQDTGQDDWDDGLDDEIRSQDRDRADAEAGLRGSVGASEVWSRGAYWRIQELRLFP